MTVSKHAPIPLDHLIQPQEFRLSSVEILNLLRYYQEYFKCIDLKYKSSAPWTFLTDDVVRLNSTGVAKFASRESVGMFFVIQDESDADSFILTMQYAHRLKRIFKPDQPFKLYRLSDFHEPEVFDFEEAGVNVCSNGFYALGPHKDPSIFKEQLTEYYIAADTQFGTLGYSCKCAKQGAQGCARQVPSTAVTRHLKTLFSAHLFCYRLFFTRSS